LIFNIIAMEVSKFLFKNLKPNRRFGVETALKCYFHPQQPLYHIKCTM